MLVRMTQSIALNPGRMLLNEQQYDLADGVGQMIVANGWGTEIPVQYSGSTPVAITGTPEVGQVLSCSAPVGATRQWLRNGSNIGGATNTNYTVQAADENTNVACRVTITSGSVAIPDVP